MFLAKTFNKQRIPWNANSFPSVNYRSIYRGRPQFLYSKPVVLFFSQLHSSELIIKIKSQSKALTTEALWAQVIQFTSECISRKI